MGFNVNWKQLMSTLAIIVVLVVVMIGFGLNKQQYYEIPKSAENKSETEEVEVETTPKASRVEPVKTDPQKVVVYISGAIKIPKVVELTTESRLYEAVEVAGGLASDADKDGINLAMKLSDGAQYIIPKLGETLVINYGEGSNMPSETQKVDSNKPIGEAQNGKLNINKASEEELKSLKGVGDVTAKRIVEYRQANDGFKTIDELKNVKGIGDKKYEDIKDRVTVG